MKLPVAPLLWGRDTASSLPFAAKAKRFFALSSTLALVGLFSTGLFFFGRQFDHFLRDSSFFAIKDIDIKGASKGLEQEIRDVISKMGSEGQDNLLMFKPAYALFWIESLPRVRKASVTKEFPGTLKVEVEERVRVTTVNVGDLFWIDREGVLLSKATPAEMATAHVPLLTGVRGDHFSAGQKIEQPRLLETLETIAFLKLKDPDLSRRFSEWHLNAKDEVIGILNQGVEVRFGGVDPLSRMSVLASVLRTKSDLENCVYLDLRFESQVVYRN